MGREEIHRIRRVAFVATRVAGTDGVSLEIGKWAQILGRLGYECCYITGKSDRPAESTFLIEEADFLHPRIQSITRQSFGREFRSRDLSNQIHQIALTIKSRLYEALDHLRPDLVIAQNSLTIPMNIPLGLALVQVLLETGTSCIAHHHDFYWERERFLVNAVDDYLQIAFPPRLAMVDHIVINSLAGNQFGRRTGLPYRIIPNIMDFAHPPAPPDDYAKNLRADFGIADDEFLILQPTRVVHRKGIEHTIELVRRLNTKRCRLMITHDAHDEGSSYVERVVEFAHLMGVEIVFAGDRISCSRGTTSDGRRQYAIWDVYPQADLVAYPSTYEGFGNAFLEAAYYRKPLFCNRYSIYRTDIEPVGFQAIVMDGHLTADVVERVRGVLTNDAFRDAMVEHNYRVGSAFFSFERAERELRPILERPRPFTS
jgi:glycosyltransferase involved in cell wall biosynthesis